MAQYQLKVEHRGSEAGDFCVYQTHDNQPEDIRSLVWFSKRAHPDTDLRFEWNIDYGFTWSEQGVLEPGAVFKASEMIAADPSNQSCNSIAFTKQDETFTFTEADESIAQDGLEISCDSLISASEASVGISISGKPAVACHASPNLKYTFRPHPRYWIAFGKFIEGEVLDLNRIAQKFEIRFAENQTCKEIRLDGQNTWEDVNE